jgi:hypothetical protein
VFLQESLRTVIAYLSGEGGVTRLQFFKALMVIGGFTADQIGTEAPPPQDAPGRQRDQEATQDGGQPPEMDKQAAIAVLERAHGSLSKQGTAASLRAVDWQEVFTTVIHLIAGLRKS